MWDYKNVMQKDLFVFKGYSIGPEGQVAFGYEINHKSKETYESLTGMSLEFGVAFAGYDALGGNLPLDKDGNAFSTMVVKIDLTSNNSQCYEFIISSFTDGNKDSKLCFTAYTFDGQDVKYHQESGISDTVTFVSYNEICQSVVAE